VPTIDVTRGALLLWIARGCDDQKWPDCIRDDLKGTTEPLPAKATLALAVVQAEQVKPTEDSKTKTPANCTGQAEIEVKITRLPKAKKTAVKATV
jgi:hypothetical protein